MIQTSSVQFLKWQLYFVVLKVGFYGQWYQKQHLNLTRRVQRPLSDAVKRLFVTSVVFVL